MSGLGREGFEFELWGQAPFILSSFIWTWLMLFSKRVSPREAQGSLLGSASRLPCAGSATVATFKPFLLDCFASCGHPLPLSLSASSSLFAAFLPYCLLSHPPPLLGPQQGFRCQGVPGVPE